MSFILKILEKIIDRHIRGSALVEKPLHQNQYAYRAGMSTETALFQVVKRLERCLEHRDCVGCLSGYRGGIRQYLF
jgi:hypothetical protein